MNVSLWGRWAVFLISCVLLSACAGSMRPAEDATASPERAEKSGTGGYGHCFDPDKPDVAAHEGVPPID